MSADLAAALNVISASPVATTCFMTIPQQSAQITIRHAAKRVQREQISFLTDSKLRTD